MNRKRFKKQKNSPIKLYTLLVQNIQRTIFQLLN